VVKNEIPAPFDLWHMRHICRQLNNRSGEFARWKAPRPVSWGECQDVNSSRMKTLQRAAQPHRDADWNSTALKVRLQIDKRGKREHPPWYDQEYRMTFQINKRAYESEIASPSALWEARASYEVTEYNLRSRIFNYTFMLKTLTTWKEAQVRASKNTQRNRNHRADYLGRENDLWELAFRHAKLKFGHVPHIENSWYRSVREKMKRSLNHSDLNNMHRLVENQSDV
jgi:hypothetical protein